MRRTLALLALFMAVSAGVARAQSMGTVTENGVSMDVKEAVALLDADGPSLVFYLLPFQPTADEIAKLQAEDSMWLLGKPSPDPKKWKSCPHGKFKLGWSFEKASVGDAKKATVYIYGYSVGAEGSNININKFGTDVDVSVTGPVKAAGGDADQQGLRHPPEDHHGLGLEGQGQDPAIEEEAVAGVAASVRRCHAPRMTDRLHALAEERSLESHRLVAGSCRHSSHAV
jgi:hypothetical protein